MTIHNLLVRFCTNLISKLHVQSQPIWKYHCLVLNTMQWPQPEDLELKTYKNDFDALLRGLLDEMRDWMIAFISCYPCSDVQAQVQFNEKLFLFTDRFNKRLYATSSIFEAVGIWIHIGARRSDAPPSSSCSQFTSLPQLLEQWRRHRRSSLNPTGSSTFSMPASQSSIASSSSILRWVLCISPLLPSHKLTG